MYIAYHCTPVCVCVCVCVVAQCSLALAPPFVSLHIGKINESSMCHVITGTLNGSETPVPKTVAHQYQQDCCFNQPAQLVVGLLHYERGGFQLAKSQKMLRVRKCRIGF
jgi:hypothetical protein